MTPVTHHLTATQREALTDAIQRGWLSYHVRISTLHILEKYGLIRKGRIREDELEVQQLTREAIALATDQLASSDWENAFATLRALSDIHKSLRLHRWYLTDAGKAAVINA